MKRLVYLSLFLVLVSFAQSGAIKHSTSVLIKENSELNINGTSNISDFKCRYKIQNLNKPIRIHYEKWDATIKFENSHLVLENSGFDCGGRGINKDFHGLLQSEIYPKIVLELKEIKLKVNQKNVADALVEIEIAGKKKVYRMETTFNKNGEWLISGKLKLNINDYQLKAPTKMFGLVVVSDEIEISFNLVVQEC